MKNKIGILNPGFLYRNIILENQIISVSEFSVLNFNDIDYEKSPDLELIKIIYIDDYEIPFEILLNEYQSLFIHSVEFKSLVELYENFHERAALFNIEGEIYFPHYLNSLNEKKLFRIILRIIDLSLAIILSFFSIFIILISSLLLFFVSGLPLFFTQTRVGKNGKTFTIYKLRTMINSSSKEHTVSNDSRIFPLGMFYRKFKIDELPQLLNILLGHMSFWGPRPERLDLHSEICNNLPLFNKRLIVKPGLSGWAQIKNPIATPNESFEKLQYDLYFIKNISFKIMFIILTKTFFILINKKSL
jgi:lipopolysaccharide/colanic/teichoic acid biosynthesis glycosyltransferase